MLCSVSCCGVVVSMPVLQAGDPGSNPSSSKTFTSSEQEDDALEDDALEDDALEDDTLEDNTLEGDTLENNTLENDTLEDDALEDDTLEMQHFSSLISHSSVGKPPTANVRPK